MSTGSTAVVKFTQKKLTFRVLWLKAGIGVFQLYDSE
jgi:hypothetical protein